MPIGTGGGEVAHHDGGQFAEVKSNRDWDRYVGTERILIVVNREAECEHRSVPLTGAR